jgi:hypothetical protein
MTAPPPNYYLVLSSALLLIPGTYVFLYKNSIFCMTITYSISISSMNYWLNPTETNLLYDQLCSTIGCFFYTVFSLYYLSIIHMILAITSILAYYSVYCVSCHLYKCNDDKWVYCHIMFHFLVFVSKWILYIHL